MEYQPELGQAMFGQPCEQFDMPEYAQSMFDGIMHEWDRVWWNLNQREHCVRGDNGDLGAVHFRHYIYDDETDSGPNFWVDGDDLRIRWYKYPGRGMSCNQDLKPAQWAVWHDRVVAALRAHEKRARPDLL